MKNYYIPSIDDEVLDGAVGSKLPESRTAAVEGLVEEAALRFADFFLGHFCIQRLPLLVRRHNNVLFLSFFTHFQPLLTSTSRILDADILDIPSFPCRYVYHKISACRHSIQIS